MKEMLGSGIPTESIKRVGLSSAQELGEGLRTAKIKDSNEKEQGGQRPGVFSLGFSRRGEEV